MNSSLIFEVKALIQPFLADQVIAALQEVPGLPGVTVSQVRGFGRSGGSRATETGFRPDEVAYREKTKLEIVVTEPMLESVLTAIQKHAHTGNPGDGKIFVYRVHEVVRIRTGEKGIAAI